MKTRRSHPSWRWLATMAALAAPVGALAQSRYRQVEVEPRWMRLDIREISLGVAAEGERNVVSSGSGGKTEYDRLFVGPSLGLNLDGSVYHPNLLQYSLDSDNIGGWTTERNRYPGVSVNRNLIEYLGRYNCHADVLPGKPYRGSFFSGYSHDYRDYDLFSRAVVDTMNYGARASWNLQPLTLGASYLHSDEDVSTLSGLSSRHQDTYGVGLSHARSSGNTSLGGTYSDYSHVNYGTPGRGESYSASLADTEQFGRRKHFRLDSSLTFLRQSYVTQPSDQLTAQTGLTVEHRRNFTSSCQITYDRYSTGDFVSDNIYGRAMVQHRLFDSLTSSLYLQAANYEASSPVASGYNRRYGVGWLEHYTKSLSSTARLTINNSMLLDHVDQQNLTSAQNEKHKFGEQGPADSFFLNTPNVNWASIRIWKADRSLQYRRGFDYELFLNGSITQVQKLSGSLIDADVVVDYDSDPLPGGGYDTVTESFGVRLSLWDNRWGLYTRGSLSWNNAPATMRVASLASYTFGTDYTHRWLRLGAEYSIFDSSLSQYNMARTFESVNLRLGEATVAGLDFSQTWLDYESGHRQQQDYRFVAYVHRTMARHLRLGVRGGYDIRTGEGVDQKLAMFRFDLGYSIGRTSFKAAYDFERDTYLDTEMRERHLFTFRVQRNF